MLRSCRRRRQRKRRPPAVGTILPVLVAYSANCRHVCSPSALRIVHCGISIKWMRGEPGPQGPIRQGPLLLLALYKYAQIKKRIQFVRLLNQRVRFMSQSAYGCRFLQVFSRLPYLALLLPWKCFGLR